MQYNISNILIVIVCAQLLSLSLASHAEPFDPMLATEWDDSLDPSGWWTSEKYDGIRGLWDGKQMWTRKGKAVALPETFSRQLPPFPLDGELWAGRGKFNEAQSTVLDEKPGFGWQSIHYMVFDVPAQELPFEQRLEHFSQWLSQHPSTAIHLVKQIHCWDRDHLMQLLHEVERQGGEGIMLREPGSAYIAGRSNTLRKVKSFQDSEAVVTGYTPGKGRLQGMVGALKLEIANGTRFSIGSGLSDEERQNPPPIGSTITFIHNGWTDNGKPRFPVYWRVRQ